MFEKTPAKAYHAAVEKLGKAEAAYQKTIDDLQLAIDQRRANDVPSLRKKSASAELELREVLNAVNFAWKGHWRLRAAEIEPALNEAARQINQYNAICRVTSDGGCNPGASFIQNALITPLPVDLLDESGVPVESTDSELLEDYKGCWR